MPLNPKEIYGFPRYPLTEETQTAEQDIKKAALEGVNDDVDPRLKKVTRDAVRRQPEIAMTEIEIEIEMPEPEKKEPEESAQDKLDKAMQNNSSAGYEYPDSYFMEHLVSGLTSKNKNEIALGKDCLKEVVALLPVNARCLLYEAWEAYFKAHGMKGENDVKGL